MKKSLVTSSKPYTGIVHTVLISLLALAVIYLGILNYQLKTQLDSVFRIHPNPDKIHNSIPPDSNTSVILTFIGVGFALFAFLTFQSLKDFYQSKISEIEKKHEEHETQYQTQYQNLSVLESNLNHSMSILMEDISKRYLKEGDVSGYVMAEMVVCEKLVLIIQNQHVSYDVFKDQCRNALSTNIRMMENELDRKRITTISVNTITPEVLKARQITILNGVSGNDYQSLNRIFGMIELQPIPN